MAEFTSAFVARDYQLEFMRAMEKRKRAFLLYHRRAGKDMVCWNYLVWQASQRTGTYYYILPTYAQAKKVIWDGITEAGMRIIDYIPRGMIDGKPNNTEMKIRLTNGSVIQALGSDNPDSIRGTNPLGVVFSEFAMQEPRIWSEIISPILVKNGGWAVFNTTPFGHNHAYDLWSAIQDSSYWFTQRLTVTDTGLITPEQIKVERDEGRSEEIIEQEYYCSFERGIEGSYFGRLIAAARLEGRIGAVPYEPRAAVNTYWDLGYGDSTAIVFAQTIGHEFRILDYYEASGEKLSHYAKVVKDKPYVYGKHYLPHDAGAGNLQTGISLHRAALDLGLDSIVLPRIDFEVGIDISRNLLTVCSIDSHKCKQLIKCLECYHKKFNEKMGCYSDSPQHDWSSHGADALRYAAIARQHYGSMTGSLSAEKIKDMRMRNYGY